MDADACFLPLMTMSYSAGIGESQRRIKIVSYKNLWVLLVQKELNKKKLMKLTGISTSSMAKLSKGANVTTDVLFKICEALNCDFKDIMEYVPENK